RFRSIAVRLRRQSIRWTTNRFRIPFSDQVHAARPRRREQDMAKIYYDNNADLALVRSKKVAVLGYGSQGHAHALNLKDSGVEVAIGLHAGSRSRQKAEAAGLKVLTNAEATKWGD